MNSGVIPPGIWAIIPAAGVGRRMKLQQPKQYLQFQQHPVIVHSIRAVARSGPLRGILVGLSADDSWWTGMTGLEELPCPLVPFEGGAERADTVLLGLKQIHQLPDTEHDWVLVHDAVRPLVRKQDIENLISTVANHADGGLLALPVADTLKREQDGCSVETVDRSRLWRALTPQYFPATRLRDALEQCQRDSVAVTDEASAMEHIGAHPRLVAGHADNIKITFPSDLQLAEALYRQQRMNE